jgi:glycosyltransferase involved in cell wall biosynthesis
MMKPLLSLIVITYNRRDKISHCLASLEKQTLKDFELIVVVDGSTDGTLEMLNSYDGPLSIKVVSKPNEGRSISRNLGAQNASTDILVFLDDDMTPLPECIEAHYRVVTSGPRIISVGTQEELGYVVESDFDQFRMYNSRRWERSLERETTDDPYLTGANFAIRKELFDRLNGFDRRAEVIEDFDLGIRAVEQHIKLRYNNEARAMHDNRMTCSTYIRKQIEYYRSYINLRKMRGNVFTKNSTFTLYEPGSLKMAIFNILSRQSLVSLVDRGSLKYILPRTLRFKLYDILITGLSKVYPERFTLQAVHYHGQDQNTTVLAAD